MRTRHPAVLILLPLLLVGAWSCRPAAPAATTPAPVGPRPDQGIVTFTSGVSWKSEGGDWTQLDIGRLLEAGDAVKTAEGAFCEIQFGRVAVVRLESSSVVLIDDILAEIGNARINVRLVAGSILCKVQQLSNSERFRVRTQSAICGVRGTEFGVSTEANGTTQLYVKSGAVTFTPLAADPDRIAAAIPEEKREAFTEVVEEIDELAPVVVVADQEARLTAEAQNVAVAAMKDVEERIARAAAEVPAAPEGQKPKLPVELEAAITRAVADVTVQLAKTAGKTDPVSGVSQKRLAPLQRMRILEQLEAPSSEAKPQARGGTPDRAEGQAEATAPRTEGATPQPVAQPRPELAKVAIQVEPADAGIYLAAGFIGTGSFAGYFEVQAPLSFTFERESYAPQRLQVVPVKDSANLYQVKLEPLQETIRIEASPQDAAIILDGAAVATGTWEGRLPLGSRPTFIVKREGYVDRRLELEVTRGSGKTWSVTLERQEEKPALEEITVTTVPSGAEILLDGRSAGTGTFTASYAPGTILSFEVRKDGYLPGTLELTVTKGMRKTHTVSLARKKEPVEIAVTPQDAEIVEAGKVIGKGSWSGELPVGSSLLVTLRRLGFESRDLTVAVKAGGPNTASVELEPRPVLWQLKAIAVEKAVPVWRIAAGDDAFYFADSRGTVHAVSRAGAVLWSVETANTANENSVPVIAGQRIVLTGGAEMVVIDRRTGRVETRRKLEGDASHIFGRRVLPLADGLVFPEENALVVMDAGTAAASRRVDIPAGSQMSPAAWNGSVLIVDKEGTLLRYAASSWELEAKVATEAVQPVAIAATVVGDRAYFADRKGLVVCVDLAARTVAWQRKLDEAKSVGVFQDLAVDAGVVCAYAKNTLYLLSAGTGAPLYAPIAGVSAPAALAGGQLVYGTTDGILKIANPTTGKVLKSLTLGARIAAQPLVAGDRLALALANGDFIVVYPQSIR